jgi:hypothetical protein
MKPALEFLREHGGVSLVSLGCGARLNRIDNHLRLFRALNLKYYVGIDLEPSISVAPELLFVDRAAMPALGPTDSVRDGHGARENPPGPEIFKLFPGTRVEELRGIHCAVVVCQRVLPFVHWEHTIHSMTPVLVLQEDLHGCELQSLNRAHYQKSRAAARHFKLQPFRPWRIFPGERNLILWKRNDFFIPDYCGGFARPPP